MENKILRRYIFQIKLRLASPLCISNGISDNTDVDVINNGDGEYFIPGSSIAGAMRGYYNIMTAAENKKDIAGFAYGYTKDPEGKMSALFFSDVYLADKKSKNGKVTVTTRDSVKLEDKVAVNGAKFDYEIIESGAESTLYIEAVIRERDDEHKILSAVLLGIRGLEKGEIRLGYKKNRGNGKIEITEQVKSKKFDSSNAEEWPGFYRKIYDEEIGDNEWDKELPFSDINVDENEKFLTIKVPLRLTGGISIRVYAAKKDEPDFEHITEAGEPIIPGTSWAGAIRTRMQEYFMYAFDSKKAKEYMNAVWGYVNTDSKNQSYKKTSKHETPRAQQSNIIIEESVLEDSKPLHITRNKISRFEAGTVAGALYMEKAYFGGTTTLVIKIRDAKLSHGKDGEDKLTKEYIRDLLMPALEDIQHGYLAIGGQTAVGRGIFEENGEIEFI